MKVIVLGAGVLGASTALELLSLGAEVTLVEADRPGSGTSSRGAGLVSEAGWHPTSVQLVSRSIEILERFSREGEAKGHPFRFHQTGSTTLLGRSQTAGARELATMQRRAGVPVREVDPSDVPALPRHEGMRVDDVRAALHYPRDGWALPRLFSEISTHVASLTGAEVLKGDARLLRDTTGIELAGSRHTADAVVVACGVWTRRILQRAGLDAPLLSYRTQALKLSDPRATEVPIVHDTVQGFYLRPGVGQHLVAGNGTTTAPEDIDAWRAEADPAFVDATLRRLRHRFPYLKADGRIDAWAGIEAATPDRLMLAGPHPGAAGVWLLAGGNGYGFMRAPAVAESMAAMIVGKSPPVDLSAYAPSRFTESPADFPIREGFSLETPA